jgi:O-antigen/teichoic acid export membrane protein
VKQQQLSAPASQGAASTSEIGGGLLIGLLSHGALVVQTFVLPAIFIGSYGHDVYGEWLSLSVAVGWLLALDFGLQSFVVNQSSIERGRGDLERMRNIRSEAIRATLGVIVSGAILVSILAWAVPAKELLRLSLDDQSVRLIIIFLAVQVLHNVLWGQLTGVLQASGQMRRSALWRLFARLVQFSLTLGIAWLGLDFWLIPAGNVVWATPSTVLLVVGLLRLPSILRPHIRYWSTDLARQIAVPSL